MQFYCVHVLHVGNEYIMVRYDYVYHSSHTVLVGSLTFLCSIQVAADSLTLTVQLIQYSSWIHHDCLFYAHIHSRTRAWQMVHGCEWAFLLIV